MTFVKDFWNIPIYNDLLEPAQRYINGYVVGKWGRPRKPWMAWLSNSTRYWLPPE